MDRSAGEVIVTDAGGDFRSSSVRRRLVQSTLFPHKSPENVDGHCKQGADQEVEEDEEEYCGSQSNKKKRRQKPKALSAQSKASKKVSCFSSLVANKSVIVM